MIRISRPYIEPNENILAEISEVIASGYLTNGKYVKRLEDHIKANVKTSNVVAVSSATSGLILLFNYLRQYNNWKRVYVPSFTFKATIYAMHWAGLEPVFADIDDSLTIDSNSIIKGYPHNVKRYPIVGVHTFGNPVDIDMFPSDNIVFDAAHALGSFYKNKPVGGFGIAEVFSMAPTKVVTACEGGLVCTNNNVLADYLREMRCYGNRELGHGLNARMSEVHAIIGYYSAKTFAINMEKRLELVSLYKDLLTGNDNLISFQRLNGKSSWNYFGVRVSNRDEIYTRLVNNGIECKKYFEPQRGSFITTSAVAKQILVLPLHYYITEDNIHRICELI